MEVDMFASQLSRQLPRFYSWRLDPEAEATDAFIHNQRVCKPPMVPDTTLPHESASSCSLHSFSNPTVAYTTMVGYGQIPILDVY